MSRFLFPEWTQTLKKFVTVLALGTPLYLLGLVAFGITPEALREGYQPEQPVPYSHATHVGKLGLSCEYCHNTVTKAGHAAIPPAATCMNCHTSIHYNSPKLQPVREAYTEDKKLAWVRVHDLPDYSYFNHSAHVTRGVGCESCHGRIDQMEEVYQVKPLTMGWCLDCHNNPEPHLREPKDVTVMGYVQPEGNGAVLREKYQINPSLDCSTCHR